MRYKILTCIVLTFGLLGLGTQDTPLTEVLNAHRKSVGHDQLDKLYGIEAKGVFSLGPAAIPVVARWHQGRLRVEYDYGENKKAISVYTLDNSWKTTPWSPSKVDVVEGRELTDLREMAQVSGLLCNLDRLGYVASLPGPPQENTVLVDPLNGDAYRVVLNAANKRVDRVERDKYIAGKYQTINTIYKNYTEHGGFWFAREWVQQIGGKTVLSWKFDEIRTKVKMDENLFEKP
ncbi:MAG: hypothetical protein HYZ16_05840 [Bacteroidetes bacterium]|nr:hypothetical protein [Bacteroidota bacterium]